MAQPSTREELRKYGLRQNGYPVVQINVAKQQQEDLLDDTIQMFQTYINEGTIRFFQPLQLTQADIDNGYIQIPDYILSVSRMFSFGTSGNTQNIFTQAFNLSFYDMVAGFFSGGGLDLQSWTIGQQYIQMVNDLIGGEKEYEFNYLQGRLYIFSDMKTNMKAGDYIMLDVYRVVDPNDYPKVWNHIFVKKYYTAILKKQWGSNLKKFGAMQLPGGVELNGKEIYDEAIDELEKLEDDIFTKYAESPHFIMA